MDDVSPALCQALAPGHDASSATDLASRLHHLARTSGFSLGEVEPMAGVVSFEWRRLVRPDRSFSLLVHEGGAAVALSSTVPECGALTFVDDAALGLAAKEAGVRMLTAEVLNAPLTAADTAFLAGLTAYAADVRYWKPATVGDVIFNWWD